MNISKQKHKVNPLEILNFANWQIQFSNLKNIFEIGKSSLKICQLRFKRETPSPPISTHLIRNQEQFW